MRSAIQLPHWPGVDHRFMALLAEPAAPLLLADYPPGQRPDERDLTRLSGIAAARGEQ